VDLKEAGCAGGETGLDEAVVDGEVGCVEGAVGLAVKKEL